MNTAKPLPLEGQRLATPGFIALLLTQLLTAVNDNVFRWLAIGIGKDYVSADSQGWILMAGTASFVVPYLVLAPIAGYFADRYAKRSVIVACKLAEIAIMGLGILMIVQQSLWGVLLVVACMGAQSALFAPSRQGTIPEMLHSSKISAANGLFGLISVAATVVGMILGSWLSDATGYRGTEGWWLSAVTVLGIAVAGAAVSYWVPTIPAACPARRFPWNAPQRTLHDLGVLAKQRALLRVALGMMFFWSVGALAQLNIDQFALESGGGAQQTAKTPLLAALVLGVGVGSVLAGVLSRGRIELGLLPLGALGVVVSCGLLFFVPADVFVSSAAWTAPLLSACGLLLMLGVSAGLFNVPLEAFMQHHSAPGQRGAILSAANLITFAGVAVSSVLFAGLRLPVEVGGVVQPWFSSRQIFLLSGAATIPVLLYIVTLIPQATVRFCVWLASLTIYRIRVYDRDNLPEHGGAMLVSNHVSWLDGLLLLLSSSRPIRMIAYEGNFKNPYMRWWAQLGGLILMSPSRKSIARALQTAREALANGELVCIFPEGGISRSGTLQTFKPGMLKIIKGTKVPVIPIYLDGLWGSIFSFQGGRFFWKLPRRWPYPISIFFGKPIYNPSDVHQVRQAVVTLGTHAVNQRTRSMNDLTRAFIRRCKQRLNKPKVADGNEELTGGTLLLRTLVLRRLLRRLVLKPQEQYVGVLLPPSVVGVITNMALSLDRRVAVNLNYSASSEIINQCIHQAGITHVLTSRQVMSKLDLQLDAEVVMLEDLKDKVTLADKMAAATAVYATPSGMLARSLGLHKVRSDDVLTVIFTSGSTGTPKGVMLTYSNVGSNAEAVDQVVQLNSQDVLLGILPFFHSFGYTVCLWTAMTLDIKGVYHYNPLDARNVGKLCKRHGVSLLLSTPTFLRGFLRRCTEEQFKTLDVVVAGAEKLPSALCDAFEEKFHVRPVEGYGATECSPLVSVNVPPSRTPDPQQLDCKEGTVGRPIPGVSAKILDPESGEELGAGHAGMLWIHGPNVMKGYLGRDDLTTEVLKDGWYCTGDIALIDSDGFLQITGRQSRFSKIGGEMVPHIQIEETLAGLIEAGEEEGLKAAVTAVPDAKKGERLVVVHEPLEKSPEELCKGLAERGLPNLYIPACDCFLQVDKLPLLGSGKLDLKQVKKLAEDRYCPHDES